MNFEEVLLSLKAKCGVPLSNKFCILRIYIYESGSSEYTANLINVTLAYNSTNGSGSGIYLSSPQVDPHIINIVNTSIQIVRKE